MFAVLLTFFIVRFIFILYFLNINLYCLNFFLILIKFEKKFFCHFLFLELIPHLFHSNFQLTNFLEEFYLKEQVVEIAKMARFANQLKRVGHGLGEHIWDQELLQKQRSSEKRKSI